MSDAVPEVNDPDVRPAKFGAVYLVCKACGKRSSGPKKLKPKEVAGLVRRASKTGTVRSRVVLTTCLGLCPKKATAVAHVASGTVTRIVAIGERKEVDRAVALLHAPDPVSSATVID
jgi:predicted metal-binding protein